MSAHSFPTFGVNTFIVLLSWGRCKKLIDAHFSWRSVVSVQWQTQWCPSGWQRVQIKDMLRHLVFCSYLSITYTAYIYNYSYIFKPQCIAAIKNELGQNIMRFAKGIQGRPSWNRLFLLRCKTQCSWVLSFTGCKRFYLEDAEQEQPLPTWTPLKSTTCPK